MREFRSNIVRSEQAKEAVKIRDNPSWRSNRPTRSVKIRTRKALAIESKLPERKIRYAQEIKKRDPAVSAWPAQGFCAGLHIVQSAALEATPNKYNQTMANPERKTTRLACRSEEPSRIAIVTVCLR